jgi:hypothetical protein
MGASVAIWGCVWQGRWGWSVLWQPSCAAMPKLCVLCNTPTLLLLLLLLLPLLTGRPGGGPRHLPAAAGAVQHASAGPCAV